MKSHISIAGVSERDIDLLLLEEFQSSPSFRAWFANQTLGNDVQLKELISAQRSVNHSTGESDLEIAYADIDGNEVRLLIENKVNAGFQSQQAQRYRERGNTYVKRKECAAFHTIVIAPKRYFGMDDSTKGFDRKLTYEAVVHWFTHANELGERAKYKVALLNSAIDKGTLGYQPIEDAPVTKFWSDYWQLASELAPNLEMKKPQSKPSRAGFIYFRPEQLPDGIEICHKFKKGYVDLQINGMGKRLNKLNRLIGKHPQLNSSLTAAGKSAAIRLIVPKLDPNQPLSDQLAGAREGVQAAKKLLVWFPKIAKSLPDAILHPKRSRSRG